MREPSRTFGWHASPPVQLTSAANSVYGPLPVGNGNRVFSIVEEPFLETRKYSSGWQRSTVLLPDLHMRSVQYSPGGKWVAFLLTSDVSLWRSRPDGSDRVFLVGNGLHVSHPAWSPDASKIAFEGHFPGKPPRAYLVNAEGGAIRDIVPVLPGMVSLPAWSPDGQTLAVALNVIASPDSRLPRGIFLVDLTTNRSTKLPASEVLTAPSWSPDGKFLIAKTYDESKILRFDSAGSRWVEIAAGNQLSSPTWSRDSRFLYFQEVVASGAPLYRLNLHSLRREKVFSFESVLKNGVSRCIFLGFAPDGSPLLELTRGSTELYALDLDLP